MSDLTTTNEQQCGDGTGVASQVLAVRSMDSGRIVTEAGVRLVGYAVKNAVDGANADWLHLEVDGVTMNPGVNGPDYAHVDAAAVVQPPDEPADDTHDVGQSTERRTGYSETFQAVGNDLTEDGADAARGSMFADGETMRDLLSGKL